MPPRILLLIRPGCELADASFAALRPAVQTALLRLESAGITEEELESLLMETDGAAGLAELHLSLRSLARRGLLSCAAHGDRDLLATASGGAQFELSGYTILKETSYIVSRFAFVRRVGTNAVIESARSSVQITLHDGRAMEIIALLTSPCRLDTACGELSKEETGILGSLLLATGMIETAGDDARTAEDDGPLSYWTFHDLLFHSRTRLGRHLGGYGATYPFRGRMEAPSEFKSAMSDDAVQLDRPELDRSMQQDAAFTAVLERRRTRRRFGVPPLHRRHLGEFLYRTAGHRPAHGAGAESRRGSRPYPGGGAVYELEIYLSVGQCLDLLPGFYHYRPVQHQLSRLPVRPALVDAMLQRSIQAPEMVPQVLLTIAARFSRVFWKYESMGYALVLKDVGVLMQTMYLVAEAMDLSACALGGGDADLFADASGIDTYTESSVGEFLIGSRAEGDT